MALFSRRSKQPADPPAPAPMAEDSAATPPPVVPAGAARASLAEIERLIRAGAVTRDATISRLIEEAGLGSPSDRLEVRLDAGTFAWHGATGTVSSPLQILGTRNTADNTWLWGWDHPSVKEPLAAAARSIRAFGEAHHAAMLTIAKGPCTDEQGWMFAHLAIGLGLGDYVYRAANGATQIFLLLTDITVKPVNS